MIGVSTRFQRLRSRFALLFILLAGPLSADEADSALKDTAFLAATTLDRQLRESVNRRIPVNLRFAVKCVAVFPSVVKAGLTVAAKHANGLIACRQDSGAWSAPAVFSVSAASIGIQAGIQNASYILLFMDDEAVTDLFGAKLVIRQRTEHLRRTRPSSGELSSHAIGHQLRSNGRSFRRCGPGNCADRLFKSS